ncbi:glycosyltransferase [Pigmentiphaga kullae]|uniref:GT2 family glycosyltransferase n=1 Tax=Pigmentiphaga kullae TaxID=151784 RepID=A0A4Q7N6R7_9BURK|nr:glycosyltransferase [Pigmentiphaga kullae]RZS77047.1 GT2 family glycosyltransferase [Pigmentiphaga kullae]
MTDHYILQNFVFPDETLADRVALYARWVAGPSRLADTRGVLPIAPGTTIDLATFFNAFSHRKWHALTGLGDLAVRLRGEGTVEVTVHALTETAAAAVVCRQTVVLGDGEVLLPLPGPASLPGTILALEVRNDTSTEARLLSVAWVTAQAPLRPVRLAGVITTFKREAAAREAMRRFSEVTIPRFPQGELHLYVIDNGQTLDLVDTGTVTLLHNPNLGGAGGFARGLMEARKAGHYTHVLFMDDDASCEPESVWRTVALLARCKDERAGVAGAMLYVDRPTIQFEKGAVMRVDAGSGPFWRALNHLRDLSDAAVVADNDGPDEANYGAWWYFAFPLAAVRHMPFPFFVRGDDTDFSLSNDLPVVTLNGVATWCDNFGYKLTPPTHYLAWRSWWALALMHGEVSTARHGLWRAMAAALDLAMRFDYAGAMAVLDGLEDAAQGPRFFGENPAPFASLAKVKGRDAVRAASPEEFESLARISYTKYKLKRLLGLVSVGGLLIPDLLLHPRLPHARIGWEAGRWNLLRARAFVSGAGAQLNVHVRDRRKLLAVLCRMLKVHWRLTRLSRSLIELYRTEGKHLRTSEFWQAKLY